MTIFRKDAKFGDLTLIKRAAAKRKSSENIRRRWKCLCSCGTEIIVPEAYLVRKPNPKTHCGCKNKTSKTIYNREYRIWLMMHTRCYNDTHMAYKHYGGRGIKIHESWNRFEAGMDQGFENFIRDVGPAPTPKHSIDRINVDGNYEPGNVRWATDWEQAQNRRK